MSGHAPEIAVAYVSIVPEIQGFARQLREQIVGPAGDAGADAGEAAGGGLKDKLKVGAAAAAIAAGAVIAKGIGDAIEQANVTSKLQAQLGATGKDAAKYGKVAGQLYSKGITENFEQGAEAIRSVVNGGLIKPDATNKQLESIATKMSDVATTFGTDMGMQTQAVSALMKNGLAKNADEALDVITTGFQKLGPNAEDLLETFQEYPRQLQKLGLDAKTSMGLFSQGLKGGARDTDIIADSLKEFSIRSIDMSTTSRDAYKALGINAGQMEAQIAKGGKGAQAGLQTVLDKLRAMKDPVKRNAAAVGLFGTQAEDLGDALFKLDPSKAVNAVGKVGGSAKKLGDTLRSGPSYQLQVFQRRIQQGLTEAMGKYVVPALTQVGSAVNTYFVPAIQLAATWAQKLGGFVSANAPYFAALSVVVGGLTLALKAQAIWTGITTGVMKGVAVVTRGWAAAQALLNAVMALNPFVLVAIAIAALVAGIIVAYQKSETFRSIVQAAFSAVQVAVSAVVDWFTKSFVPFFTKTIPAAFGSVLSWVKKNWPWILGALTGPIGLAVVYVIKHWDSIRQGLADGWGWIKKNVLYPIRDFFTKTVPGWAGTLKTKVVDAFTSAAKGAGKGFKLLQDLAKAPISFVINTVYNRGIVGTWNKIASAFGAPKLGEFHPKGFARGGILPGMSSWRNGDDQLVPMRRGEGVYVSEAMRDPYERARLHAVNSAAMRGQSLSKFREPGFAKGGIVNQGFAKGGIFGWIGNKLQGAGSAAWDKVKAGASWLKDGIESSARAGINKVVKPLIDRIPGSSTLWGKAVRGVPNKMVDALFGYSKTADQKVEATGVGGKGTRQALRWAKAQAGKPYIWGGVGPKGFDCSGFMSAIQNVILGKAPNRRQWATGAFSGDQAPSGWVRGMKAPFTVGITNAGVGHTAGTLNGVNVESRGGAGVVVGSKARSYRDSLFTDWYGFAPSKKFDSGGWLMPGARMTANETGKPEPVFTAGQWSVLSALVAKGADGNVSGGVADGTRLVLVTEGGSFEAYVDQRADDRIKTGLTGPAGLGRTL
jgi:phage-related minor tail protein